QARARARGAGRRRDDHGRDAARGGYGAQARGRAARGGLGLRARAVTAGGAPDVRAPLPARALHRRKPTSTNSGRSRRMSQKKPAAASPKAAAGPPFGALASELLREAHAEGAWLVGDGIDLAVGILRYDARCTADGLGAVREPGDVGAFVKHVVDVHAERPAVLADTRRKVCRGVRIQVAEDAALEQT